MKLIIETYKMRARKLSNFFYRTENIKELKFESFKELVLNRDSEEIFYLNESTEDLDLIKYYFNEIIEIRNNYAVFSSKKKRKVNYFEIKGNEIIKEDKNLSKMPEKKNLPFLNAQNEEIILFPSDDED